MNNIAHKAIVLKLNKNWQAVEVQLVGKAICDLVNGVVKAVDVVYETNPDGTPNFDIEEYVNPVSWEQWITLPVYDWHESISSTHMTIRVPTVVICKDYAKVPEKKFKGKPTKEALAIRDNLIDAYTGKELDYDTATKDHVVPLHRGGKDTYDNVVLTTKEINNMKGSRLNSECGLDKMYVNPHNPKPILFPQTIRKSRHQDWDIVLGRTKKK